MTPMSILVVDDESHVRDVLQRHLRQGGHWVKTASDGIEAFESFGRAVFDVVIVDLNMPRMGGVELVRRLKETAPRTITIVLTGHGTLGFAIQVLREGCDDFLLKPISDLNLVSHAIERCHAHRNALLMAVSSWKISEAKDHVLSLVIDECACQLGELGRYVDLLENSCAGSNDDGIAMTAKAMRTQIAYFDAVLKDVKLVNQTLQERSELEFAVPELKKEGS